MDLRKALSLYAITDRHWVGRLSLYEQIEEALKGGASILQLREKNLPYEDFLKEASEIKMLCNKYDVPLIINDNVDLAKACDAHGVHVGQSDMECSRARYLLGKDKIIGVSCRTLSLALEAEKNGASYIGCGAVFPTTTKTDTVEVSYSLLKSICESVSIPVVAIGGITSDNLISLKGSGISGVAVISSIFGSSNIYEASKDLRLKVASII